MHLPFIAYGEGRAYGQEQKGRFDTAMGPLELIISSRVDAWWHTLPEGVARFVDAAGYGFYSLLIGVLVIRWVWSSHEHFVAALRKNAPWTL
jgi:hypothetical protein